MPSSYSLSVAQTLLPVLRLHKILYTLIYSLRQLYTLVMNMCAVDGVKIVAGANAILLSCSMKHTRTALNNRDNVLH